MSRKYSIAGSFEFAMNGIRDAFANEPNFRFHTVAAFMALVVAILLAFTPLEFVILLLTIIFVLILELFNTSMEKITDLVSPEIHPKAKVAKDVSAAAVFLGSVGAVLIGLVLYLPKILLLILPG
ncbi:hypothetical protein A3D84_03275 [Candidatus Woesebacteria bacterium RIFCSPHIGHO2_02_FULL_42_20]|uniref:Diacylglycerol kinase n=1 Tax=Candidatus Woesebacteria bacterium RIFCSPHIGHO2_12_FULL_41_24 TaxID=1802510 RepID=A0A1F8ARU6_9BACT|nr:MAG: hypothetical protein A2W15_03465 [Candidatus Woesebacteria bacterium RBG_16_41_13]OGM28928.1 MAG: hypothetical protein A2873_01645 [Candidatus Woesebacteria bacterium RIFCSPHIGHO2_01_FULL_42_80]OGM34863.1 MAG: hypothetical protein A3D84_03275 [Candidatus Woesebacteria bacterium RIFCSPHIGHO2_02_FULL_42_20]OGM54492.1 MAG: hypothetical protein A3E44_00310 [Candidatus Woesebacteria bacterium RIFCSPHIGHO2_12_FULL_41_24]OGM65736.1 MAG: hypothetical protein A2969_00710 [Candidatus Woesebacteri